MDFDQYANILKQSSAEQQAWSAEQAQKQMGFQWAMSSTAHQREMEDLKKAGLNPILAANTGASSAAGAMGQTDSGLTGALAGLMEKMIDVNMVSAQAALKAAGSGSGYGYSSSSKYATGEFDGLDLFTMLMLRSLGLNPSSAEGRAATEYLTENVKDNWIIKWILGEDKSSAKAEAEVSKDKKNVLEIIDEWFKDKQEKLRKLGFNVPSVDAEKTRNAFGDWFKKHVSVRNPFKK